MRRPGRPLGSRASGATDCHFHVFRPGAPLALQRSYTPNIVELEDWLGLADAVGISRGVLVQPSVYGFDNTVLLEALQAAPDRLRGVVVLPPDVTVPELERLHRLGVRGVRCNTRNLRGLGFDAVRILAPKVAALGWTLQFQVRPEQLAALASLVSALDSAVVIDHLGFVDPRDGDGAVRQLQALLDTGRCYAKISAPYRLSRANAFRDFGAVTAALSRSHPERLIWGSDWPHTELWDAMPDDAELIDMVADWLGNQATRQLVLVDTPRSLFFKLKCPAPQPVIRGFPRLRILKPGSGALALTVDDAGRAASSFFRLRCCGGLRCCAPQVAVGLFGRLPVVCC